MSQEIRLPKFGNTMEDGTIVSIRVNLGDEVRRGTALCDIETDKATMELESPADGFIKAIIAEAGRTVAVDAPLFVLGSKDEQVSKEFIDKLKIQANEFLSVQKSAPVVTSRPPLVAAGPAASLNILVPHYQLGQKFMASPLQRDIAAKMLKSKREIPCFYLNLRVDVTELVAFREKINQTSDVRFSLNDFIVFAMAKALKQFPIMTGQLAGDSIKLAEHIGIGLAVAMPDGYLIPILKEVENKNLRQIAVESKILIEKAKSGKLPASEYEGGCITLSNLGAFGVESFIPIVVPGQCSILGVGKIMDSFIPINDTPVICKTMNMTLAVDHKVANGAYAAQFFEHIKKTLEDPTNFQNDHCP